MSNTLKMYDFIVAMEKLNEQKGHSDDYFFWINTDKVYTKKGKLKKKYQWMEGLIEKKWVRVESLSD